MQAALVADFKFESMHGGGGCLRKQHKECHSKSLSKKPLFCHPQAINMHMDGKALLKRVYVVSPLILKALCVSIVLIALAICVSGLLKLLITSIYGHNRRNVHSTVSRGRSYNLSIRLGIVPAFARSSVETDETRGLLRVRVGNECCR